MTRGLHDQDPPCGLPDMISNSSAVAAAVAVAAEHGLRVREPVVLNDSFNLRIHLLPAPIVARVPTVTALGRPRPADVLRRELEVVSYLCGLGAPVVPPSDLLPAGLVRGRCGSPRRRTRRGRRSRRGSATRVAPPVDQTGTTPPRGPRK